MFSNILNNVNEEFKKYMGESVLNDRKITKKLNYKLQEKFPNEAEVIL